MSFSFKSSGSSDITASTTTSDRNPELADHPSNQKSPCSKLTLRKKVRIPLNQLAIHRRARQTSEGLNLPIAAGNHIIHIPRNLLNPIDRNRTGSPQALDDGLRADTLLYHVAHFFEDFASEHDDGGGSVADLGVLRAGDVREDAGGGVDYVEELYREERREILAR
jgi:hypothetical protein